MINLTKLQKEVYQNKVEKGFNVTDVAKEIVLIVEELGELARAYKKSDKKPVPGISNKDEILDAVGDMMVYCLGLCEMLGADSEKLLAKIVENNRKRTYTNYVK